MIIPEVNSSEHKRLQNLKSYSILDTLEEIDYDYITSIASELCGTPIALISLIDDKRQWFKSHHGLDATETPKDYAFCAHAINKPDETFIVQDAREDVRFYDNPLVTGDPQVIFYAGVSLVSDEGFPLGTLCVIDNHPRNLTQNQLNALNALSNQVINLLRLRKNKALLEQTLKEMEDKNKELEQFAFIAAHDLKSPLISIAGLIELFSNMYKGKLDEEGNEILELISGSSDKLRRLIDGLLDYSRSEHILKEEKTEIDPEILKHELASLFAHEDRLSIVLKSSVNEIFVNRTALDQILINLISNAIKYNDKEFVEIEIGLAEFEEYYEFYVSDNGPGIAQINHDKIFKIFERLTAEDKFGRAGNGIGLATVKKITGKMGGSVWVESELGKGAKFNFKLGK